MPIIVFDNDGHPSRSPRHSSRFPMLILVVGMLLTGCGRGGNGVTTTDDPEVNARLVQLTRELHHTMAGRKINRDFDEFVALAKIEVPAPPPGKKYAINEKWQVVLVNK